MTVDQIIVFIHVIAGVTLAAFASISQLIIGPAVKLLTPGSDKEKLQAALKKRRRPVVDTAIVIQLATAIYFLFTRWEMISQSGLFNIKAIAGFAALLIASFVHFVLPVLKKSLKEQPETIQKLNSIAPWLEKTVLVGALSAFLLGAIFNHL